MPLKSAPRLPNNSFMCFLQEYRDDCPKGRQNQKQLAEQAGRIWGKMSDEQKTPFVQKARQNKRIGHRSTSSESRSSHEEQDEQDDWEYLARGSQSNRARTTTRRKCNKPAASEKNMAHRLIECLLCHCDAGHYARDLLHQFTWKVNDHFPGLPDETFFLYYKILIGTFVIVAFLTVILSFWQWLI